MKHAIDAVGGVRVRFGIEEAIVKRLSLLFLVATALLLGACAPNVTVQSNVLPTLISVTVPPSGAGNVVLQGRYFGDGFGGASPESYVIVGADISGGEGMRITPTSWTSTRIELPIPEGAGSGFIYVVVDGVRSNGIPANLP
jgi:hypothetical protein